VKNPHKLRLGAMTLREIKKILEGHRASHMKTFVLETRERNCIGLED